MSRLTLVLAVLLAGVAVAGTPPPSTFAQAIRGSAAITLLEGLPHPEGESEIFEKERAKPHKTVAGYPFYEAPLVLKTEDAEKLRALLGEPAALERWSGEKKCGGFHPDYAIEVEKAGVTWRALVCFGCGEVKLFGGSKESTHDMSRAADQALRELLTPYRKNRPAGGLR